MNKIGKLRCGVAIKLKFDFYWVEMKKFRKLRCGEALKFEFDLKELDMGNQDKRRQKSLNLHSKGWK